MLHAKEISTLVKFGICLGIEICIKIVCYNDGDVESLIIDIQLSSLISSIIVLGEAHRMMKN